MVAAVVLKPLCACHLATRLCADSFGTWGSWPSAMQQAHSLRCAEGPTLLPHTRSGSSPDAMQWSPTCWACVSQTVRVRLRA